MNERRGEGIACADRIRDFNLNALRLYELTVGKHRATVLAECDAHGSPTESRACLPTIGAGATATSASRNSPAT